MMEVLAHLALQRLVMGLGAFKKLGRWAWEGMDGTMDAALVLLLGLQALAGHGEPQVP